jgi:major vault protein
MYKINIKNYWVSESHDNARSVLVPNLSLGCKMSNDSVIRIKPQHYIHVLDNSTNVTRVVVGPYTFTRQEQERVVLGPNPMIMIPPRHYCIIQNPVVKYVFVNSILFSSLTLQGRWRTSLQHARTSSYSPWR